MSQANVESANANAKTKMHNDNARDRTNNLEEKEQTNKKLYLLQTKCMGHKHSRDQAETACEACEDPKEIGEDTIGNGNLFHAGAKILCAWTKNPP